jgi:hypothetical protein
MIAAVRTLYDYESHDSTDLGFKENQVLLISDISDPDWWIAHYPLGQGQSGRIPSNYVERVILPKVLF